MKLKNNISLIGGLITALLSTVCCIVPLLLLTLGIGGSWIANLSSLEPYKPLFIFLSIILLIIAYWQIFLKKQDCEDGKICAQFPKIKYKIIFWIALPIIISSSSISLWAPFFY